MAEVEGDEMEEVPPADSGVGKKVRVTALRRKPVCAVGG